MKQFFLAALCLVSVSAHAQTAEEIIQKYNNAMGGLEAFSKVTSAKMTGHVLAQGMEMPLTTQIINNKSVRTDVEAMGQNVVSVYDNGTGWKINPFAGAESATDLTSQELIDAKSGSNLVNHLMDYKNRGHKVEFAGQQDIEGVKCYNIKLTNKEDNKVTNYFIIADSYLLLKSVSNRERAGEEVEVETFYSDFKAINGLQFAMHRSQKINGEVFQEIKLDKVELNVPVDEKIFKKE